MKKINISDLLIYVLLTELIGAVSSLIAGGNFGAYYDTLVKPPLSPPGWLFSVAWGILYALMGISAYFISETNDIARKPALDLYRVQLAVNALWSPVFFGLKSFGGAVAVVIVMLVMIVCMLVVFGRIRRCAAYLNIPYLLWTLYATYLTVGFFVLN